MQCLKGEKNGILNLRIEFGTDPTTKKSALSKRIQVEAESQSHPPSDEALRLPDVGFPDHVLPARVLQVADAAAGTKGRLEEKRE